MTNGLSGAAPLWTAGAESFFRAGDIVWECGASLWASASAGSSAERPETPPTTLRRVSIDPASPH